MFLLCKYSAVKCCHELSLRAPRLAIGSEGRLQNCWKIARKPSCRRVWETCVCVCNTSTRKILLLDLNFRPLFAARLTLLLRRELTELQQINIWAMWVRQVWADDKTCDYTWRVTGKTLMFVELVFERWEWTIIEARTWCMVTFMSIISSECRNVSWLTKNAGFNLKFKESE